MTSQQSDSQDPRSPHRYVSWGNPRLRWRTCALCGIGANARIHRPVEEPAGES